MKNSRIVTAESIEKFFRSMERPEGDIHRWINYGTPESRLRIVKDRIASNGVVRPVGGPDNIDLKEAFRQVVHEPAFSTRTQLVEMSSPEAERPLLWRPNELSQVRILETTSKNYPLDHTGWYCGEEGDYDRTLRTAAVIFDVLPHIAFYVRQEREYHSELSGENDVVYLDSFELIEDDGTDWEELQFDALKNVIRTYDSRTQEAAESEREYQNNWRKAQEYLEAGEELKGVREEIREVVSALKDYRSEHPEPTKAGKIIEDALKAQLRIRKDLMNTRRGIVSDIGMEFIKGNT